MTTQNQIQKYSKENNFSLFPQISKQDYKKSLYKLIINKPIYSFKYCLLFNSSSLKLSGEKILSSFKSTFLKINNFQFGVSNSLRCRNNNSSCLSSFFIEHNIENNSGKGKRTLNYSVHLSKNGFSNNFNYFSEDNPYLFQISSDYSSKTRNDSISQRISIYDLSYNDIEDRQNESTISSDNICIIKKPYSKLTISQIKNNYSISYSLPIDSFIIKRFKIEIEKNDFNFKFSHHEIKDKYYIGKSFKVRLFNRMKSNIFSSSFEFGKEISKYLFFVRISIGDYSSQVEIGVKSSSFSFQLPIIFDKQIGNEERTIDVSSNIFKRIGYTLSISIIQKGFEYIIDFINKKKFEREESVRLTHMIEQKNKKEKIQPILKSFIKESEVYKNIDMKYIIKLGLLGDKHKLIKIYNEIIYGYDDSLIRYFNNDKRDEMTKEVKSELNDLTYILEYFRINEKEGMNNLNLDYNSLINSSLGVYNPLYKNDSIKNTPYILIIYRKDGIENVDYIVLRSFDKIFKVRIPIEYDLKVNS